MTTDQEKSEPIDIETAIGRAKTDPRTALNILLQRIKVLESEVAELKPPPPILATGTVVYTPGQDDIKG